MKCNHIYVSTDAIRKGYETGTCLDCGAKLMREAISSEEYGGKPRKNGTIWGEWEPND